MEGRSSNINKPPVDPSTMMGTGAVKKVLGDGTSTNTQNGVKDQGNGATVIGTGKDESGAGKALLGMMAGNNIVSTNGFLKGKVEEKPVNTDVPDINLHAAALLADGPAAQAKFVELMNRASRGAESISGKVSPREIELGGQAVIPLENKDGQFANALRLAFSLADRVPTLQESVDLFHSGTE